MRNLLLLVSGICISASAWSQTDVLDARSYGVGQTVTVTAVATNGSELGSIRYMQDNTAGIAAYGSSLSGVNRGDSITVTGQISDFSGLMEISPVTNVVNHGPAVIPVVALQIPITSASEALEAELIQVQNVTFVQTGNFAGNTTYQVTDGTNNFDVRVNNGTNMVGTAIPTGAVSVTGPEGQFNANYQIVPRDLNDIVTYVAPTEEINVLLESVTVLTGSDYFIGNSSTINVTIENYGTNNLDITGATFTGPDAAYFSSNIGAVSIAGGSSQSFTINYTPLVTGSTFAAIEIGSNDTDENPYVINFEGVGIDNLATEPSANPTGLTFPFVEAYTLGGQYNAGTGAGKYLVLWKVGSPIVSVPVDGTTYLRGDIVGDATVAYMGPGTAFTPRGIIANQDYYFAVYAFNGQDGFENYQILTPATGNVTSLGEQIGSYYSGIDRTDVNLNADLKALINPHTQFSYFLYKQTMMNEFEVRDTVGGQSVVTCVYSGENKIFNDPFDWTATGYSREHTFCHSWMPTWPADNPELPEYTDQHHLYPANLASANTPRSNLPLGEITGSVFFNYLEGSVGEATPGGQMVYEPRDSHKGNAARAMMYMVVSYDFPLNGNVNSDNQDADLIKTWHFNDLPDNKEIARHEYIYNLQGNRNPFIDSVDFACYIDFDANTYIATGCQLGLNELVQNSTTVFPVPSHGEVYVQVNSFDITGYEITDMQGRLVRSESGLNAKKLKFDSGDLRSGAYMIRVITDQGESKAKIVMQ